MLVPVVRLEGKVKLSAKAVNPEQLANIDVAFFRLLGSGGTVVSLIHP